jgi:hypothetical protein
MNKITSAIAKMPGVWQAVWTSLRQKYSVNISQYNDLSVTPARIKTEHKITPHFWNMSTVNANKKGWDWWGDTDVNVVEIVGPKTFEEVII